MGAERLQCQSEGHRTPGKEQDSLCFDIAVINGHPKANAFAVAMREHWCLRVLEISDRLSNKCCCKRWIGEILAFVFMSRFVVGNLAFPITVVYRPRIGGLSMSDIKS